MSTDGPSNPEPPKPPPPQFDRNDLVAQVLGGVLNGMLSQGKSKDEIKEALQQIKPLLHLSEFKDADWMFDFYVGHCMMEKRMIPVRDFMQRIQRICKDPKTDAATVDFLVRWLMHAAKR